MRAMLVASWILALSACSSERKATGLPPLPELPTITVQAADTGRGRTWDGVIEAVQRADLSAQTAGRVAGVDADVNDHVLAGAVLLRLTTVEQQAGANVARAQLHATQAAAAEADATLTRYSALATKQLVSRLQIDQLRAARDSAAAARDAARARLIQAEQQMDYTVVRAPFAGVVSSRRAEPGESIAVGQTLISLYSPAALRIQVQVPQSEADAIGLLKRARVQLTDGRGIDAAEVAVFPSADPASHSVAVRVVLPELADPPRPGATAKVVFAIADAAPVVRIPSGALIQRGEISGAYVLDGNRLFLRQLRLGTQADGQADVLAGLRDGEKVVSDPVAALQALTAQRKAAGQAHE